jgi:phosphoribosylanthranilate isomerase
LLTSRTQPAHVVEHVKRCGTNVVQLVDAVPTETYAQLRAAFPALRIVQVIHVGGEDALREASAAARHVDALLLDSGNPSATTKVLGGTGETHDWSLSAQIVAEAGVPVFLAGGLNEQNVAQAIAKVRPYGVDLCSSLRTNGKLDANKVTRFIAAVHVA